MESGLWSVCKDKKCVIFDGDGTLYLGNQVFSNALAFLDQLTSHGIATYICTNNSSKTPQEYVEKYKKLNLPFTQNSILISSHAALDALKEKGITSAYILGTTSVIAWFDTQGIRHTEEHPECILLTYDTELTYQKMEQTTYLIRAGIPYFATHPDMVCPTDKGPIPDVGSWIEMFNESTGRRPDEIFGKPSPNILTPILKKHDATLSDIVFVGDRLYTDIALGQSNALTTVLVLSGETTAEMLAQSEIKPDLVTSGFA